MEAKILRTYDEDETRGKFIVNNIEICKSLELKWLDNKHEISCIPEGKYEVIKRQSEKYRNHFHVLSVPNRDMILIHSGNYAAGEKPQTHGCILVGKEFIDINADGFPDVTNSRKTLATLYAILPEKFELIIEKEVV